MARLLDPKKRGQKKYPFAYVPSASTDIRATFDRLKPGWNKPEPVKKPDAERVVPIRRRTQ